MPIRIALLDDHQIVLDGLKLLLSTSSDFEIVLEETNGLVMLEKLPHHSIDILLTDITMPVIDGYEVCKRILDEMPSIKTIALSMNGEGVLADKMISKAGVSGYLLKTADRKELIEAIKAVYNNDTYYCAEIKQELGYYQKTQKENEELHLTQRELEIIKCISEDLVNKQIADRLFISERTVETHRKNIFRKTGVHSVLALIEFAKKRQII